MDKKTEQAFQDIWRNSVFINSQQKPVYQSPETGKTISDQCNIIRQTLEGQDKKIAELHTSIKTLGENLRLQNIAMEELKGERNILKQENSKLEKMEYKSITINDYFESTDKMLKEIYNLITTKMVDFLKDGQLYSKVGVMEVLGSVFGYVDTFVKGKDFHCQDQKGVREAELNKLREFAKIMGGKFEHYFQHFAQGDIDQYVVSETYFTKGKDKDFDLVKGVVEDYGK